jgi:hypothetical protein
MIGALTAAALACAGSKPDNAEDAAVSDTTGAAEEPREADEETAAPAAAQAEPAAAAQRDTISRRPVDIALTIGNSRTYAGSYRASGVSRGCGNMVLSMTGQEQAFNVEFPYEGDFEIVDLSFAADTLAAGAATDKYYLSVSLKTKDGGRPPSFVLRTNEPRFKETGKAKLAVNGGTAQLGVEGRNDLGETLQMTVVCKPNRS